MNLGVIIKKKRLEENLSQKQFAGLFGVSRELISKYETNFCEPNLEFVQKFCVFFNLSADEVLEIDTREQKEAILKLKGKID